jgi:hypothetical protein
MPEFVASAKLGINIQQIFEEIMEDFTTKAGNSKKTGSLNQVLIQMTNYSTSACCQ